MLGIAARQRRQLSVGRRKKLGDSWAEMLIEQIKKEAAEMAQAQAQAQAMAEMKVARDFLLNEIVEATDAKNWESAAERIDELAAVIRNTWRLVEGIQNI